MKDMIGKINKNNNSIKFPNFNKINFDISKKCLLQSNDFFKLFDNINEEYLIKIILFYISRIILAIKISILILENGNEYLQKLNIIEMMNESFEITIKLFEKNEREWDEMLNNLFINHQNNFMIYMMSEMYYLSFYLVLFENKNDSKSNLFINFEKNRIPDFLMKRINVKNIIKNLEFRLKYFTDDINNLSLIFKNSHELFINSSNLILNNKSRYFHINNNKEIILRKSFKDYILNS
jgi:hypothetical protein